MNQTVDHWIAVADTLKQQRDQAEAEREKWELSSTNWQVDCRVAQSERDALRKELDAILAKRSQVISVGAILEEVATLRAERDALRKDADIVRRARARSSLVIEVTPELLTKDAFTEQPLHVMLTDNGDGTHLLTFRESEELHALRKEVERLTELAALSGEVFAFAITDSKLPNLETRRQLHDAVNRALTAAMAVQPTTGGEDE
jgi:hypothetical protein